MNKNQKIAIGCGVAGCLGLILLVIICVILVAAGLIALPGSSNANRHSNFNTNSHSNLNSNDNTNSNSNSDTASSSSMSDDDRHKLFQAAATTQDQALIRRVWGRLGLLNANGTPNDAYAELVKDHIVWVFRNSDFLQTVDTPEKARAYVDAHIDD